MIDSSHGQTHVRILVSALSNAMSAMKTLPFQGLAFPFQAVQIKFIVLVWPHKLFSSVLLFKARTRGLDSVWIGLLTPVTETRKPN